MDSFQVVQEDLVNTIAKVKTNFKKTPKERLTVSYIETRIENLKELWQTFVTNHRATIECTDVEKFRTSKYYKNDVYDNAQELFIECQALFKDKLTQIKNDSVSVLPKVEKMVEQSIKLPNISIPSFSGKYTEWPSFRDLFRSLIHNNNSLDEVQKLHYLKSYLVGEAEQLLRHIPITSSNYNICWSQLEHRYNNKKYLANCILKKLMSQRNLQFESASAIKELLDTTNECLNALKNLEIDISSWDIIIIYIISLKLDNETRKQWESKICDSSEELPKFIQFSAFLEQRFRSLEFLDNKNYKPKTYNAPSSSSSFSPKSHHVTTESTLIVCPFCNENHKLYNCKKFAKEDNDTRRGFVQSNSLCFNCLGMNHTVYNCRQSTRCRVCKKKHHSLLHSKNQSVPKPMDGGNQSDHSQEKNVVAAVATTSNQNELSPNIVSCFTNSHSQVLLATALVKVNTVRGVDITFRSLIDQGSQASFVTESAVQLLGVKKIQNKSLLSGIGSDQNSSLTSNSVVSLKLQSLRDPNFVVEIKAHVLKRITSLLPEKKVEFQWWPELQNVYLADPTFDKPNKIDLLLGAEVFGKILDEGLMRGPPGCPIAQNTKLGWILSGEIGVESLADANVAKANAVVSMHTQVNENELLKKFWELESEHSHMGTQKMLTDEEQRCEEIFNETTRRDETGRYIVKLPFRDDEPKCIHGESLKIATKRFIMSEKRLLRNPDLMQEYNAGIKEYLDLGHAEFVPQDEQDKKDSVYLPQVIVVRNDKTTTKVRICFDASCKGSNGVSLNDELMIGPKVQLDLRHIIMRWRLHPICLVADIVKMYRQVKVSKTDADFQRFLWREKPKSELQQLRLLRITFGTASAPYMAVKALQQTAYDEGKNCPFVADKILKDFYMDDLLTGCQTVLEGEEIYDKMKVMLEKGGFELQKWSTNNDELLEKINKDRKETTESYDLKIDEAIKILGLTWDRNIDEFVYSVELPPLSTPVTKRKAISDISRLFDPIGWLAPTVIIAKIFIQKIWISGIGWDEQLPSPLLQEWIKFRESLSQLKGFSIPRWMNSKQTDVCFELQGFSDASNEAYAAVVYLRTIDDKGEVHVSLVTSKTKVAPIKQVSTPKLELCGAVLLSKLLLEVSENLGVSKANIHAWTDSSVVLAWLRSHPSRWKTFIANRVSEIVTILDVHHWSHVKSKDNPADCASRGLKPQDFVEHQLWIEGLHFSKGYICLFVCMATRAIHLEAVSDLTAQGFLSSFKRFVARRGHCADIWSDNGTNFIGAARELKKMFFQEKSSMAIEIADKLATNGTNWHFIPPHSPNFGGLWEAGIKSTKYHLKRVIGNSILTFEEITTLLAQIEACLNSRPISQISTNSEDSFPLTPGHFLIGEPLVTPPDFNYETSNIGSLKRWQLTQRMLQDFWRRWSQEYLTQFLHRYKWAHQTPEPKVGDIVLVKEDDLPPARWLYGIITEKHPGLDKITRVVSLRCKGNVIKRPISKLCILPLTE